MSTIRPIPGSLVANLPEIPPPDEGDLQEWEDESEAILTEAILAATASSSWGRGPSATSPNSNVNRGVLVALVEQAQDEFRQLTARLATSSLSLARWAADFGRGVGTRVQAGVWAIIGRRRPEDFSRPAVLHQISRQFSYLSKFRDQIRSGLQLLGPDAEARSALYGSAIWGSSYNVQMERLARLGYREAIRILGSSRHCSQCPDLAGFWVPIGSMRPIGSCLCKANCACTIEFR